MKRQQNDFFASLEDKTKDKEQFYRDLHRRNAGLLADALSSASILVVGAGSVGSYMAEELTRAGVGEFILIDPDLVETHNLTRASYRAEDVGQPKVTALKARLQAINPYALVTCEHKKLEAVAKTKLKKYVKQAALIVCAADDKKTQAILNRIAAFHDKPMVTPGLYAGAKGGEVVLTVPGLTPCLTCSVAGRDYTRNGEEDVERKTDYGTGRQEGMIALGCDMHHVAGAAVKITLSLLSLLLKGDEPALSGFVKTALVRRTNYLLMAMEPDYWIFKDVFRDVPAQHGWQSLWLHTSSRPDCPVCGEHKQQTDPIRDIAGDIDAAQFEESPEKTEQEEVSDGAAT
jgi:molybdopterin/thiamine biosynthesis adenylyltransferase